VQVEFSLYLHFILGRWTKVHHLLWSARKDIGMLLRLRIGLWLRREQLSIDGRTAIGVVVKGVTPRVGKEHRLGCGGRLDLEIGFRL